MNKTAINNRNKNNNKSITASATSKVNQNKKKNRKNLTESITDLTNFPKNESSKYPKDLSAEPKITNQTKSIKKSSPEELSSMVKKSLILTNKPPESSIMDSRKMNSNENKYSPPIKKMERANSFFLTRKISKFINVLTGSKENLTTTTNQNEVNGDKISNETELPYKFTRSRSMILLRPSKRRSAIEPELEQLCEEAEKSNSPEPAIDNVTTTTTVTPLDLISSSSITQTDLKQKYQRKKSLTLVNTLKRTFSNSSASIEKYNRRKSLNPKWSSSLQSLQEIDNMVSYENLSFIDYDKFNEYQRTLERRILQTDDNNCIQLLPSSSSQKSINDVVRREKRGRTGIVNNEPISLAIDTIFDRENPENENIENNDGCYSLDDKKIQKLKQLYGNDFQQYDNLLHLNQINCEAGKNSSINKSMQLLKRLQSADADSTTDVLDSGNIVLKSKSLTHLDVLDSMVSCHRTQSPKDVVSSSEYFSVSFCTEIGYDVEEFIPVSKGVTLSEALSSALKMRNLNFSQIIISDNNLQNFCESGYINIETPPYSIALDENTNIERLAGKHLIVTEKDDFYINRKNDSLQKAASFGSKVRPPRLLSSASTEETTSESEQKIIPGKQLKQRWSGLFGIKNPQQAQLCELLNRYAKLGVPQKLSSVNFDHPEFDLAFEYLDKMHSSWQEFVLHDKMPENEIKIQSAIWELVTTEVDYIHALQTVTDLFLACLEAIQKERILIDVDQMKLFSNIRDICEANLKFWIHYLYPMVANSIKTQNPLCINYFQSGFLTFATNFGSYKKYCAEQSTCQFYCKELNQNNSVFTSYLAWCESQKMCNRLRLADILVRPMQRLTKYSLLLTAIRKHISDENDADNIDSMIHSVENFVYSVNTHLTTRQENERLKGIMARIEAYDVVDASNEQLEKVVKQYNQMFDLCAPMNGCSPTQCRHLFMEGDLKLKDNISKTDVHCFLLTDILLICKTIAKKGQGILKVIRQPYMTDRLIVKHKENSLYCVYLNEFQVGVAAFILQCAEAKNWLDGITKAKHIYSRLKQGSNWDVYNNYRLASIGGNDNSNNMLGVKKSPLNSSFGSRVSSLNNSHSGSIELNDSRNISVDFEKANSLSSDEGSLMSNQISQNQKTLLATSPHQQKSITSNTLKIHPVNNLGQSLPNLNIHQCQASNNTLLVPDHISSISGNLLLSPCHRGMSHPPPSPTRATLRRGMAFSGTIKNPPLVKSRNITSQNSINWHQNISSQSSITPPTSPNQQLPPKLAASNSVVTSHGGSVPSNTLITKILMNQQSDV